MITIRDLAFTPAPAGLRDEGLLGWVTFVLADAVRIDGVQVRRTRLGRRCLSFPHRVDSAGTRHDLVAPIDAAARAEIEEQVLAALDFGARRSRS